MTTAIASPFRPRGRAASPAGFSLVEVTLALGIMAFCMISILGLLPVGMNSLQIAREESRASTALNLAATSVRSVRLTGRASGGVATYQFPQYFSDKPDAASNPTTFDVGGPTTNYAFSILEDGSIRKAGDITSPVRQTMFVQVTPPATDSEPLRVYVAVAWPWKGTDLSLSSAADLKGRQGLVDSLIIYTLRDN